MELNEQLALITKDINESLKKIEDNHASKTALSKLEDEFKAFNKAMDQHRLATKSHRLFETQAGAEGFIDVLRNSIANSPLATVVKNGPFAISKSDLNSYGSGTGVDFVPTQVAPTISYLLSQGGVARQHATVLTGLDHNLTITKRNGHSTAAFTAQSTTLKDDVSVTPTAFTETSVSLSPKQVCALGRASEKLLYTSAINVAEMIAIDMTEQAGLLEDNSIIKGDGSTASYGNINGLNNTVTGTGSAASGGITIDLLLGLPSSVHESVYGSPNARYWISGAILQSIKQTKASGSGQYFLDPTTGEFKIGGYPVTIWHRLDQSVANGNTVAYFGDMRKALTIGQGADLAIKVDMSRYFDSNQVAFKLCYDFDAVVVQPSALVRVNYTS